MKGLIRFLIRTIPRPILIRFSGLFSQFFRIWYKGDHVECPVCENTFRKFLPYGVESRANVLCPTCLSLERHRLIWLYFNKESTLLKEDLNFLHVAPEQCFLPRFKAMKNMKYITGDLVSPIADMHFDVHDIPLDTNTFDLVMCNHVMEHVRDDYRSMSEFFRVLKPGGLAILQVPQDYSLAHTYEDPSIIDPLEREKHFLQKDHVRLYGKDYGSRMEKVGFVVEEIKVADLAGEKEVERYRLAKDEILYLATKPL